MSQASLLGTQVLEQFVGVGELDEVTESEGHDEDDNIKRKGAFHGLTVFPTIAGNEKGVQNKAEEKS